MADNFAFLRKDWPLLATIAEQAEAYLYTDPHAALMKLRLFGEKIAERVYAEAGLQGGSRLDQMSRLREIQRRDLLGSISVDQLHRLRKMGNPAAHDLVGETKDALLGLRIAYLVAKQVMHVLVRYQPDERDYVPPERAEPAEEQLQRLKQKLADLEQKQKREQEAEEKALAKAAAKPLTEKKRKEREERVLFTLHTIPETEQETRLLIDQQLRDAGWEADTQSLTHAAGVRPQKNRNLAIAEWPFTGQPADYALFAGKTLVGIVEAKKARKDIPGAIEQARRYAEAVQESEELSLATDPGAKIKVPFLFAANGRPYLEQFKTKSGIWFHDTREPDNHPKALLSFHTPEGLLGLLEQSREEANRKLKEEPYAYLQDPNGLALRDYQVRVIQQTEEAIRGGRPNALIVMATGTGKTRTAVGLAYRLLKSGRFRRILFLVDRTALANQSADMFKDARVENLLTFTQIYEIKELNDRYPELSTRVHFATVQGLVQRLFYSDSAERPPVDTYDCIIVDEAHRGYFLDKELDEEELFFKNQWDYQSKYRQVLAYFDATKIALTATPAKHTTDVFGPAIATYSYREAVLDGYLVDHGPPTVVKTALSEEGIKWQKGEKVKVFDPTKNEITELENVEDELKFDVAQFNRKVVTENFNRVVVAFLAKHLDPDSDRKTLIFAATTAHADMLVVLLKEAFPGIEDDAVMKITGAPDTDQPHQKIKRFKNERNPNIVVTVDYLTTGIDVPQICNIVFLRRISSRVLYEQMMGRATRLCPEIQKDCFTIYDAVGIYDKLIDYSQMKPVVTQPQSTLGSLIDELERIETPEQQKGHVEAILGKLQRKRKALSQKASEDFETHSKGSSVADFIRNLRSQPVAEQVQFIKQNRDLFEFFDRLVHNPGKQLISEHEDRLVSAETGYPNGMRPADYIHSFQEHLNNLKNSNEYVALRTILQRPSSLKRKDLKALMLHLEEKHYDYRTLKRAYEEMNNQEMAASIIGLIRQQTLGLPLVPHDLRVGQAIEKLKQENEFTKMQQNWLDRIGEQLRRELVIDQDSFDREPFRQKGGFRQLNKVFENRLPEIMERLHEEVYSA